MLGETLLSVVELVETANEVWWRRLPRSASRRVAARSGKEMEPGATVVRRRRNNLTTVGGSCPSVGDARANPGEQGSWHDA